MARAFKNTVKGYSAFLEKGERKLLRTLFQDVILILGGDRTVASGAEAQLLASQPDSGIGEPEHDSVSAPTESATDVAFWQLVEGLDVSPPAVDDTTAENVQDRVAERDPALQRLLPDGVSGPGAPESSAEFRALTEDTIRDGQISDLQRGIAAVQQGNVTLDETEAVSFARALNSVRLVLATRLGIEDEKDAERVHDIADISQATDVETYLALLYNFISWLQETLMLALTGDLDD